MLSTSLIAGQPCIDITDFYEWSILSVKFTLAMDRTLYNFAPYAYLHVWPTRWERYNGSFNTQLLQLAAVRAMKIITRIANSCVDEIMQALIHPWELHRLPLPDPPSGAAPPIQMQGTRQNYLALNQLVMQLIN